MKILEPIKTIGADIYGTTSKVVHAGKTGMSIGKRTSEIYKSGRFIKAYNISKSVGKQIKRETTIENLPVIAGAIGVILPYPMTSVLFYCCGKLVQSGVKFYKNAKVYFSAQNQQRNLPLIIKNNSNLKNNLN